VKYFPAPAKLNLFLHVVGRRADGYHLLQSVFRLIERGDELGIELRNDGVIRRLNAVDGVPAASDLCLRAANLLKQHTRSALGADIELVKKLPVGGGLGGGSSDAATVLLALNHLWNTRLSRHVLQELGARLGADVPFFLFGESAFVEGIGERLTPVKLKPAWYLVLAPAVQVPTAEIFDAAGLKRDAAPILPAQYSAGFGTNALEPVARARYPEVARHLDWLSQHAAARMTGSGACVFAEFPTADAASRVLESLPSGMQGFVARGLDRHPLYDLVSGDFGTAP
jgi:4-diphosphocytidyl-2-C-methyl-D-erythritol kinase